MVKSGVFGLPKGFFWSNLG